MNSYRRRTSFGLNRQQVSSSRLPFVSRSWSDARLTAAVRPIFEQLEGRRLLSATTVVPPMQGWAFYTTNATGDAGADTGVSGTFVSGPATPPLGSGSARLTTGTVPNQMPSQIHGDESSQLRNSSYAGVKLSELQSLGYSTYITSWNGQQAPYLSLNIDLDGDLSSTGDEDKITFEPPYQTHDSGNGSLPDQGAVQLNTWQNWNALEGGWYSDNGVANSGPGTGVVSLSAIIAADPNATIYNPTNSSDQTIGGIRLAVGFADPTDPFDANVDAFNITASTIGLNPSFNTTYDFEKPQEVWVNDNWNVTNDQGADGLDNGDTVDDSGFGDDNQVSGKTFGIDAFSTVQDALAAVDNGAIIHVLSGQYAPSSPISISKSVTLLGEKPTTVGSDPSRDPSTATGETIFAGTSGSSDFNVTASGVTIKGFTFRDTSSAVGAPVVLTGTATGADVENNVFTRNVFGLSVAANNTTVSNNYFVQDDRSGTNRAQGINVNSGAHGVVISSNTILTMNTAGAVTPGGIVLTGVGTSATISNNIIAKSTVGVRIRSGATATLTGNDFDGPTLTSPQPANVTDVVIESGAAAGVTLGTSGSPNQFGATGNYIDNRSANNVDAVHNTFDDLDATHTTTALDPATMTAAQLFELEDRIIHGVDLPNVGLVRVKSQQVYVTPNSFVSPTTTTPSIQRAINAATAGDTINVQAGTYRENISVSKSVTLLGPNANIDPNTGVPVAAAIVEPGSTQTSAQGSTSGTIFRVGSNAGHVDATIKGFTINGNNPNLTGGVTMNGVMIDTGAGIDNSTASFDTNPGAFDTTMTVQNNVIENLERYGVLVDNTPSRTATAGNDVSHNKIDNIPSGDLFGGGRGRGVAFEENAYGSVTYNVMTRVNVGWQDDNYNLASPGAGTVVDHNTISTYRRGIFHNLQYQDATPATITNNTITAEATNASPDNFGLELISIESGVGVTATNNSSTGNTYGVILTGDNTTAGVTVSGGTLSGNKYGVYVTDADPQFPSDGDTPNATLSGITITGATTAGVYIQAANGEHVGATLAGGTSVASSPVGILVSGATGSVGFSGANPASLSNLTGNYITLSNGAMHGAEANATGVSFDSQTGATATFAQNYAIEDKITHALDDSTLGFIRVKASNVFVTTNSGSVQRGVDAASNGNTINIQGGSYTDASVNASGKTLALSLGDGLGGTSITIAGSLTLGSSDTLDMAVNDPSASDQISANGVTLGGATLHTANSTTNPNDGDTVKIINNTSLTASGTFAGINEGDIINVNNHAFRVTYLGNGGHNDVVLTALNNVTPPPPGDGGSSTPAPATVYVNVAWAGSESGDDADGPTGGALGNGSSFGYDQFADIQSALNAVASGGTVKIYDGTYLQSNITVNSPVTIQGQDENGVMVMPDGTDSHDGSTTGGTALQGFIIKASHVTIETLSIDGGTNQNYRQGILADSSLGWTGAHAGNLTVTNVAMANIFRKGIALYSRSGLTSGISITHDTFNNIDTSHLIAGSPVNTFEAGGAIADFSASGTISQNIITHSGAGILTNYISGNDADGPTLSITSNSYTLPATALGYPAVGLDLSGLNNGSDISNNTVDMTGGGSDIAVINQYNAPSATVDIHDNIITTDGNDTGILLYQDPHTAAADIDHNTLTGTATDIGISATDDGTVVGEGPGDGTTYGVLTRNSLTGFGTAISASSTGTNTVSLTVGSNSTSDDNSVIGTGLAGTGVLVSGAHTSVSVLNNDGSIHGFAIGIDVNGGSATITGNHIYDNTTGIRFTNGGGGSVTSNDFSGTTANSTDLRLDTTAGTVTVGDSNSFTGGTLYIDNRSSQTIDLSTKQHNSFGGTTLSSLNPTNGTDLDALYGIDDQIVDGVDTTGAGLVRLKSGYVFVTPNSHLASASADINRGIAVADTNDIVSVQNATYMNQVSISTDITLQGESQSGTIIQPPATLANLFSTSNAKYPIVYVNGTTNATITNLTVDGNNLGNAYVNGFLGVAFYDGGGTLDHVTVKRISNSPFSGVQNGTAVYADNADATARTVSITNDTINTYQKNGMVISGAGLTFHVTNDTVTGAGATDKIAQNGIEVIGAIAGGTISGNTVSGHVYSPATNVSTGILMYQTTAPVAISNNTLDGNDVGIDLYQVGTGTTISGDTIGATTPSTVNGINIEDGSATITNETIHGNGTGDAAIGVYSETGDGHNSAATISGGTFTNSSFGVQVEDDDTSDNFHAEAVIDGATIHSTATGSEGVQVNAGIAKIQNSNLSGNHEGLYVENQGIVDAGQGDTGTAVTGLSPASVGNNSFSGYTGHGGNYAIDDENTLPGADVYAIANKWGSGVTTNSVIHERVYDNTDNSTKTHVFVEPPSETPAPQQDTVYVDDDWTDKSIGQSFTFTDANGSHTVTFGIDAFDRVQDGINGVNTAGTVYVEPGTYAEALSIPKAVTLLGAESGQSASTRATNFSSGKADPSVESIITAPSVNTSSIDLVRILSSNVTVDGFVVDGNNASLGTSGADKINGAGPFIDAHNGIDTADPSAGGLAVNNLTIQNNIVQNFDHDGIALINPSNGSAVTSGSLISGNVVRNFADYGVLLAYNAFGNITNNTITQPDNAEAGVWVYDFTSSGTGDKVITVSGNTITAGHDDFGGIWANLDGGAAATLNITNNTVNAGSGVTGTDGFTNGIYLTSLQGGFVANLTGNTVGSAGGEFATGISLWNVHSSSPVSISGGSVGNSLTGIEVDNNDVNFGSTATNSAVTISGTTVAADNVGILVSGDSSGGTASATINGDTNVTTSTASGTGIEVSGPKASATIQDNSASIHNNLIGIDVDGGSATISNNHIFNNGTGISVEDSGTASISSTNFTGSTANKTDLLIKSNAGAVTIGTSNSFSGSNYYIDNASSQSFNLFGKHTSYDQSSNFRIEDRMHHQMDSDDTSAGLITWVSGNLFVTNPATNNPDGSTSTDSDIQHAIDIATAGNTVNVEGGTYTLTGDLGIDKALTLSGPNNAISPNGSGRAAEAVINGSDTQRLRISTTSPVTVTGLQLSHLILDDYTAGGQITYTKNIIDHLPGNMFFDAPDTYVLTDNHIYGTANDSDALLVAGDFDGTTGTNVDIEHNVIENLSNTSTATGLNLSDVQGTVAHNTFQNVAFYGILLANNTSLSVSANTFDTIYNLDPTVYPGTGAVRFYTPGVVNDSITGNTFENSYSGIAVRQTSNTTGAAISISGNTFTTNTYDIINLGSGGLTPAGDNIFDGVTLSGANTAQLYNIADKVVDGVDIAGVGLVQLKAHNIYVTPGSFYNPGSAAITDTTAASIQRGVDLASSGDKIHVKSGSYNGGVTVNIPLTFLGAGAGVDARTRSTPANETIVSNPTGIFGIHANGVLIDGFTIQGATGDGNSGPGFGYAIYMAPGVDGTKIVNNIIQGNNAGLALSNVGTTQAKVVQNVFQDNTTGGLTTDIYADQYTSGGHITNILIDSNKFTNTSFVEASWAIGFSDEDSTHPVTNVTISNNAITNHGRGIYLYDASNDAITANNITGATHYAVGLFGSIDTNMNIGQNTLNNGGDGVSVGADETSTVDVTGLSIHNNFIENNSNMGVSFDNTVTTTSGGIAANVNSIDGNHIGLENDSTIAVDATNNWWGSANGPTTPLNTFGGTPKGDSIVGSHVTFSPWLADGVDSDTGTAGFQHDPSSATAPSAPTIQLDTASDSGPSDLVGSHSDGITNDSTPTFSGNDDPGTTIQLRTTAGTGGLLLGTMHPSGPTWSITSSLLPDGTYDVFARSINSSGQFTDSGTVHIVIDTVAPHLTTPANFSKNEGDNVSLTGSATDTGGSGVDSTGWGAITATPNGNGNNQHVDPTTGDSQSFQAKNDGSYVATYSATDIAGNSASANVTVTVNNVAPDSVTIHGATTSDTAPTGGPEGTQINFTGTAHDVGPDDNANLGYTWDVTQGATTIAHGTGSSFHFTPDDNGSYTVQLTVNDDHTTTISTDVITVTNVAPTPVIHGNTTADAVPSTDPEGTAIHLTSTVTDPSNADTTTGFTYLWSVTKNGVAYTLTAGTHTTDSDFTFTPDDGPANFVVTLKATDKDGDSTTVSTSTISVTNVQPTVPLSGQGGVTTINEGDTFTLVIGPKVDPGADKITSYQIDWGDGHVSPIVTGTDLLTSQITATHQYVDATSPTSTYTITIKVRDDDNASSIAAGTLAVNVQSVAPNGTFDNFGPYTEGSEGSVFFTGVTDPSGPDTANGFYYSYDFNNDGDFSDPGEINHVLGMDSATVPAQYLADNGTYTIHAVVQDKDLAARDFYTNIQVTDVPPQVNAGADRTIPATTTFTQLANFVDPGADATWQVYVNYNYDPAHPSDGTLLTSVTSNTASKNFTLNHTYATSGTYDVHVTVIDKDGVRGTDDAIVTVSGAPSFQVTTATGNASGFTATFNRAAFFGDVNLYDGLNGSTPSNQVADVTLMGSAGNKIHGSLIWDPSTNTVRFVKTGGILAPDTYTITLRSSATGWHDTSGALLDGDDNGTAGDDYTTTFVISPPSGRILSIPDFARGPDSADNINVPNTSSFGIPVSISDGTQVRSVDFSVTYDPTLLNITDVQKAAGLPADWQVAFNIVASTVNPALDVLSITVHGTTTTDLSSGLQNIVKIIANVPNGASFTAAQALVIGNMTIKKNDGTLLTGIADTAVEKVAYLGDVNANGAYTGADVTLINRVVVGTDTGFHSLWDVDPVIVADIDGSGAVDGLDASYVAQKAGELPRPEIPDLPASPATSAVAGVDPNISTTSNQIVGPSGAVTLPVSASDGSNYPGGNIVINYDPTKFDFNPNTDVTLGALLANNGHWTVSASNPSSGKIVLVISSNDGNILPNGTAGGVLANVTFHAKSAVTSGSSSVTLSGPANDQGLSYTYTNGSVTIDATGPVGPTGTFVYQSTPAAPMSLQFQFPEDVSNLTAADLHLTNTTTSTVIDPSNFLLSYNSTTHVATFTFPGFARGILPNGIYSAVIHAADVKDDFGNNMTSDATANFFFQNGDADHDGVVTSNDFDILAASFGMSGKLFGQGDFSYDGIVNAIDFNVISTNFGDNLHVTPAPVPDGSDSSSPGSGATDSGTGAGGIDVTPISSDSSAASTAPASSIAVSSSSTAGSLFGNKKISDDDLAKSILD